MKIKGEAGVKIGRPAPFFGSATTFAVIAKYSIRKSVIAWVVTIILLGAAFGTVAGSVTSAKEVASRRNAEQGSVPAATAEPEEHGLPQKAVEIARPFGFPITNSIVVSWIVAAGLIIFAWVTTRDMKQVPGGAQNSLEWLVEGLYGFLESIIGPIGSSGRSGFLPRFSFSFFPPIGWDSSLGSARLGGDIRPPKVSCSISRSSVGRMPILT